MYNALNPISDLINISPFLKNGISGCLKTRGTPYILLMKIISSLTQTSAKVTVSFAGHYNFFSPLNDYYLNETGNLLFDIIN